MKKLWQCPSLTTVPENKLAEVIRAAAWSGYDEDDSEPFCKAGEYR